MDNQRLAAGFLNEIEAEAPATRKCLERIPGAKFDFKPHPTSMNMGYLALLVAEIPKWIAHMLTTHEIDFATYKQATVTSTEELVRLFDENMAMVRKAFKGAGEKDLEEDFVLRNGDKILFSAKNMEYIGPTINHWVHHRGQLTVYMRIAEIPIPSIYGPSGDERQF